MIKEEKRDKANGTGKSSKKGVREKVYANKRKMEKSGDKKHQSVKDRKGSRGGRL